jgi:F0F1-type ATP synthase membrane subunit c/vacuolar-type H+-ATPase subunit K
MLIVALSAAFLLGVVVGSGLEILVRDRRLS